VQNLEHFKQFLANISLTQTRKDRIEEALRVMRGFLVDADRLGSRLIDFFAQGSYALGTAISPAEGREYDVDVILVEQEDDKAPASYLEELYGFFRDSGVYKDKVSRKKRCIRISYSGDFHVDLVPAIRNGDVLKIPNRVEDDWELTNPRGYAEWFRFRDLVSFYRLKEAVKALKHWRDVKQLVH